MKNTLRFVAAILFLTGCQVTPEKSKDVGDLDAKGGAPAFSGLIVLHQHRNYTPEEYDQEIYIKGSGVDKVRVYVNDQLLLETSQNEHFTCLICKKEMNKTIELKRIALSQGPHKLQIQVNDLTAIQRVANEVIQNQDQGWRTFWEGDIEIETEQPVILTLEHSKRWKKASRAQAIYVKRFDGVRIGDTFVRPELIDKGVSCLVREDC